MRDRKLGVILGIIVSLSAAAGGSALVVHAERNLSSCTQERTGKSTPPNDNDLRGIEGGLKSQYPHMPEDKIVRAALSEHRVSINRWNIAVKACQEQTWRIALQDS